MRHYLCRLGWMLVLALGVTAELSAQSAQVSGRITDASQGTVPGATVTAVNEATGFQRNSLSNSEGYYSLTALPPGPYRVTTTLTGFMQSTRTGLTLVADQSARIDFTLSVAGVESEITVTANLLLEAQSAHLGTAVTERSIRELPLNVRDPMGLVVLTPGVITGGQFGNTGSLDVGRGFFKADFKVAGSRNDGQDILLDGASNVTGDRNFMAYIPTVDSTQEFTVETNAFSAEFGRTTGGVVTIVTKAGSNQFSGSAYEFYRDSKLDERGFFAKRANLPKPDFSRHQFGGVVGGPIQKDRTFFFASYEGLRQDYPQTLISTVPTDAQRRGDFSRTFDNQGRLVVIYDPLTTTRQADGTLVRQPFAGNVIPTSRLDPVAVRAMTYYPQANQPGNAVTGQNNYAFDGFQTQDSNNYSFRLDHTLGQGSRVFARYSYARSESTAPTRWDLPGARDARVVDDRYHNATIGATRVFSPTLTADLRVGFARAHAEQVSPEFDTTQLGFPANYVQTAPALFPYFDISDVTSVGSATFNNQPRNTYSALFHVDKAAGRHLLRIGADVRVFQFNAFANNNASGRFVFDRGMTQGPNALVSSANAGYGLASFLLGTGSSGFIDHIAGLALQRNYYAGFVQDDWRLTTKLTANVGVRYEVTTGQTERYDRLAWMDLQAPSPLGNVGGLNLRGRLEYVGGDNPRNQVATDKNNVAPRIGLAYQLGPRTALRAGYGIFYVPMITIAAGSIGFNTNTPWVSTIDGVTPENYLRNPFPQGFNLSTATTRDPGSNIGFQISGYINQERVGYTQQWNLSLQQQLDDSTLVDVAYLGNKGTSLQFGAGFEENSLDPQFLSLGAALNDRVPNPFAGIIRTGPLSGATVARRQLLLPYPQYTSVLRNFPMAASSIYHGLLVKVERRTTKGLTLLASYTWSKQIDDNSANEGFLDRGASGILNFYDRGKERSLTTFDTPHRVVVSAVYDVPVGRGRAVGSDMSRLLDLLIGGWTVSGIGTYQSGLPVIISRPSVVTGQEAPLDDPTPERWFNTAAFANAAPFTFGNVSRTLPNVRTDALRNVDVTLGKYIPLAGRARLQVRADAFNVFNKTRFGAPNGTITSAAFGTVTTQANAPREIQLGVKLYW
jgi:hypothetical protein